MYVRTVLTVVGEADVHTYSTISIYTVLVITPATMSTRRARCPLAL